MRRIQCGDKVKDSVSGIEGVVVGRCEYLHGTVQLLVQPAASAACPVPDASWFAEGRCSIVE